MLWVDKYRPKSLDKVIVHEDVAQYLKKLVTNHTLFCVLHTQNYHTLFYALHTQNYDSVSFQFNKFKILIFFGT